MWKLRTNQKQFRQKSAKASENSFWGFFYEGSYSQGFGCLGPLCGHILYLHYLAGHSQGALHINFIPLAMMLFPWNQYVTQIESEDHRMQRLSLERVLCVCVRNLILINISYHSEVKQLFTSSHESCFKIDQFWLLQGLAI